MVKSSEPIVCRLPTESPAASFRRPLGDRSVIDILFELLYYVVNLFKWAVILAAIFSILASFGVLDTRNRIVWTIGDFLYRVTDPVLRPIRNFLPNFGGIDLSPWVVVVLIQIVILPLLFRLHVAITNGIVQPLLYG
jgi:YggT family protein